MLGDDDARVVFGVVDVWRHGDDPRDVPADRGRRKRDRAEPAVPGEVAAAADAVDDTCAADMRRVDVAVQVDLDGAVDPHDAEPVDQFGGVRDVRSGGRLNLLEVDEEFRDTIRDHPGAIYEELDVYGYDQDVDAHTDEMVCWSLAGQWAFSPEIPARATEEVCRLAIEHEDSLRESDPTTLEYSPEAMTATVIPELEVHEGVANFFEENGVWEDDWIRGDA